MEQFVGHNRDLSLSTDAIIVPTPPGAIYDHPRLASVSRHRDGFSAHCATEALSVDWPEVLASQPPSVLNGGPEVIREHYRHSQRSWMRCVFIKGCVDRCDRFRKQAWNARAAG